MLQSKHLGAAAAFENRLESRGRVCLRSWSICRYSDRLSIPFFTEAVSGCLFYGLDGLTTFWSLICGFILG